MSVHDSGGFKLIRAARLIDDNGGPPLERGAILIEGDVIRAVGTEDAVAPPEGARVEKFSYEDKTVLPGLIDCHVHLVGIGDGRGTSSRSCPTACSSATCEAGAALGERHRAVLPDPRHRPVAGVRDRLDRCLDPLSRFEL